MEGTTYQGTPGAPWCALVGCALHNPPLWPFFGPLGVFWSKKISKKFRRDWTPFGTDILQGKKTSKNSN